MRNTTGRPDDALIRQYLSGELPETKSAAIEHFLESNPDLPPMPGLSEDALLSTLRGQLDETPADPTRLQKVIYWLEQMGIGSPADANTHDSSAESVADESDPAAEVLPLLGPPVEAGEMGTLGGYRVIRLLGRGGMGVVLEAIDPRLNRRIALKAMRPALANKPVSKQRFEREAKAAAAVEHDHIVPIFQVGEERGILFLAMPFLKGEALDTRLKREGRLPPIEVARIGRQTAEGLAAAHEAGLIHRDIKPANLWLEATPGRDLSYRVKILDFGLARIAGPQDAQITGSGTLLGTPAYMAPEQAKGRNVDERADLFSLGVVLYRAATGKPPFEGDSPISILHSLAMDVPEHPSVVRADVPKPMGDLIARLLEKNPDKRPASALEVAKAFADIQSDLTGETIPVGSLVMPIVAPLDPWDAIDDEESAKAGGAASSPRKKLLIAGGMLALAAAIAVAVIVIIKDKDGKEVARINVPNGGSVEIKDDGKGKIAFRKERVKPGAQTPEQARQQQADDAKALDVPVTTENSIGMKFSLIPSGTFLMGSPENEPGRSHEEGPRHEVAITRPFCLGIHEVTQAQYEKVMGKNPSTFSGAKGGGPNHPVDCVLRSESVQFCRKLSELPDEKKAGRTYRLPTEAEWEYACRAGSQTAYFFGDDPSLLKEHGWHERKPDEGTQPVGQRKPNPWGLYDMHGNIWEWCAEWYDAAYYTGSPTENPPGAASGTHGVVRGGAWHESASRCRAAARNRNAPELENLYIGFRVVCEFRALNLDPDRRAAKWVLNRGGAAWVYPKGKSDQGKQVSRLADLPAGPIGVSKIYFAQGANVASIEGSELEVLSDLAELKWLEFRNVKLGDAGVDRLPDLLQLEALVLENVGVTHERVHRLKRFRRVRTMTLGPVTDRCLEMLGDFRELRIVRLTGALNLTDAGLLQLSRRQLESLEIIGPAPKITDAGLKHLYGQSKLNWLGFSKCGITDDGVKKLAAALPGCKIQWDGGVIEPKQLQNTSPDGVIRQVGSIRRVMHHPNGKVLVSSSDDGLTHLWDAQTFRELVQFKGVSPVFTTDGKMFAIVGPDVCRWDFAENDPGPAIVVMAAPAGARQVAVTRDAKLMAVSQVNPLSISLWDLTAKLPRLRGEIKWTGEVINSLAFDTEGKFLITGSHDKTVRLWDVRADKPKAHEVLSGHGDWVYQAAISPDGKWIGSAGAQDRTARLWTVENESAKPAPGLKFETAACSVAFSPDSKIFAVGHWNGDVHLHELKPDGPKRSAVLKGLNKQIWSLSFANDGKTIAAAGAEGIVRLWDVATGKEVPDPDRRAAEWVLKVGGTLFVHPRGKPNEEKRITQAADLPAEPISIVLVHLKPPLKVKSIEPSELDILRGLPDLKCVDFRSISLGDAAIDRLVDLPKLETIFLEGARLSPECIGRLKRFHALRDVNLGWDSITDQWLQAVSDFPNLRRLHLLGNLGITDAGFAHLRVLKLEKLEIIGPAPNITDAGLKHLYGQNQLTWLQMQKCSISEDGVKKLAAALPECKITWDGGIIEPKQPASPEKK